MKQAIDLAKSSTTNAVVNAAVIVDPSTKQVISSSYDQVLSSAHANFKNVIKVSCTSCVERATAIEAVQINGLATSDSCSLACDHKQLYRGVACLHPSLWPKQELTLSSSFWHPLRHAAMVAIEYSAERDRLLFPNGRQVEDGLLQDNMLSQTTCLPSKKQKVEVDNVEADANVHSGSHNSSSNSDRPYLCTGYDIYLVWEPCTMCAMALVHQRIKRIFFALPNLHAGALGSFHRLQGESSLNHHYAVFRVLLPQDILTKNSLDC